MKRFLLVLLVLTLISGVSFGGWKYWQNHRTPQTNNTTQAKDDSSTNDPSEGGKFLVIKEWSVRVLLPEKLQGKVSYSLRRFEESYGEAEAADIGSQSFTPECRDNAQDLGLDIVRTTTELDANAPYIYKRNVLHSDNYWYHNAFGKDGCSKFLIDEKAKLFEELYQSVEHINNY